MKPRLFLPFILAALPVFASAADWKLVNETARSERTEPNLAYVKRLVQKAQGRVATVELAFFSSSDCRLEVIDSRKTAVNNSAGFSGAFRAKSCLAGVNGGFFTPERRPLGLMIASGRRVNRFESSRLLSGVVYSDHRGIHIVRRAAFRDHPQIAALLQTGPYLVEHSQAIRGLEATKSRSRTFIATDWRRNWAIGTTSPITLAELAEILASANPVTGWTVNRAINLDGGTSSGFFFERSDGAPVSDSPGKTVTNLLGVRAR